jgi:uncharacterized protein (DUF488 family)
MVATVWTLGHSDHEAEAFLALLERHGITAVADVRSQPHSRRAPQFGREELRRQLKAAGIAYVFLGRELGGRPEDPSLRTDGRLDYAKVAASGAFREGLARVRRGAERHRVALLCAEGDPLYCHRALLVARHLHGGGVEVRHIHADGAVEEHAEFERRLLATHDLERVDLFAPPEARLEEAYRRQAARAAWRPDREA